MTEYFDETLQCYAKSLEYDFEKKVGIVWLGENSCTDMTGCIGLFHLIDDNVNTIYTMAGPRRDTVYVRGADGEWSALLAPR